MIESGSGSTPPEMPLGKKEDFVEGWKASKAGAGDAKGMEAFAATALDKKVATVEILDPLTEIIPANLIDLWISEAFFFSRTRS